MYVEIMYYILKYIYINIIFIQNDLDSNYNQTNQIIFFVIIKIILN